MMGEKHDAHTVCVISQAVVVVHISVRILLKIKRALVTGAMGNQDVGRSLLAHRSL
jgi:hypothetical protein